MSDAVERARAFLREERAFRLGTLLTESSHPKTRRLSQTIQADVAAGIRQLLSVDEDIADAADRLFAQAGYNRLIDAFLSVMNAGRRIFFTGCGATGRLSILLEAAWRRFWDEMKPLAPEAAKLWPLCISVMAGGDFALIKAVEGFEDFPDFGRYQLREAGVQAGDVVVAITEGGETPFVIGTAWEGLDRGAEVFFVYNNPTALLAEHVERSRQVIEEPRIVKLDLTTGPMAVMGSTRMQATTAELLVVGGALETAIVRWLQGHQPQFAPDLRTPEEYARLFRKLLSDLSTPAAVDTLCRVTHFEEAIYRKHGLVTYVADSLLLDVLTDTTERSPTFMVPPFRKDGDTHLPVSWAFVKDPHRPTEEAWEQMLQRPPRGLRWGPQTYQQLNAPPRIQANPPKLDNEEIDRFRIGNEPDASRTEAADSAMVAVGLCDEIASLPRQAGYHKIGAITIGPNQGPTDVDEHFHFACELPASPLRLWEHLAIKLALNTISTATMVRMGRVIGNAMVWLSPSNKKLIDRGTRLISQVTGCSYEHACEVLHQTIEDVASIAQRGEEAPSPVALAIERISAGASSAE
jgi:N-acetylmuramic acid 6-phosphate etherase